MLTGLLLLTSSALTGQLPGDGTISGTVINRTNGKDCPCRTAVVLRVHAEGQFVPFLETTSDDQGKFRFERLPLGNTIRYLVGANHDEVHYPGPRVTLTEAKRDAAVELTVYDAAAQPNPLVIRQYEITLAPEPGALRVTESMVVVNPSSTSFVGKAEREGEAPVTLRLSIPADFERATFQEEFYGRRFHVADDKVVTSIPWPPGRRELKFTYVMRSAQTHRLWQRPLDLPCSEVRVRVRTETPDETVCALPSVSSPDAGEIVFQSSGQPLPAGHVLQVELGRLPVPWTAYGRWLAAGMLLCLVTGASLVLVKRRRTHGPDRRAATTAFPAVRPKCKRRARRASVAQGAPDLGNAAQRR
jgi:hypothetical protein